MDYETGLLFAFLSWLWGLATIVINVNSRFEKNLNKVGQRLSWLNFAPKPMEASDEGRPIWKSLGKFLLIAVIGLPFVLLSWGQVLIYIGTVIYQKSKDAGVPQSVKEFRWRMRNVDMSFDEIIKEMLKLNRKDLSEFDSTKEAVIAEMREAGLKV